MKRMLNSAAVVVLFALVARTIGCVSVQSREYVGVQAFAPTQADSVAILRAAPTRPNLRLGEVTVEPKSDTSVQTIEQKFRQAAAKMGANALVIVSDKTELMGIQE